MRKLFDRLWARAGFHPHIAMEVVGVATSWTMARAGIGAALLPLQFVRGEEGVGDSVKLFALKGGVSSRQPAVVTRRGQYLSEYAQYAIKLLSGQE